MTADRLAEQEFVAHLFAPLDGPNAAAARRQLGALWQRCREQLDMRQGIPDTGLPCELPAVIGGSDGAVAGLQDAAANCQAIVRRDGDVLNMSLLLAPPIAGAGRRPRIGAVTPPGWYEFSRWWGQLSVEGVGAFLGTATAFLAKATSLSGEDVRTALPAQDTDAAGWWMRSRAVRDFLIWEVTPGGGHPARRLIVVGRPGEDAALSTFAWSAGDVALPPFARYLMHGAKLRYQARVRGDGTGLGRLRDRVDKRATRLTAVLRDPAALTGARTELIELAADEAALAATLERLRRMRRGADAAVDAMTGILAVPLAADARLGRWLDGQLDDDAETLDAARQRAERVRQITGTAQAPVPAEPPLPPVPSAPTASRLSSRVELRMGFGIDVVDYSGRTTPQKNAVQQRIAELVEQILAGIGVALHDTDRQDTGDGMNVVLPSTLELHRALPGLLYGWRDGLAADNRAHDDRIRLRLSLSVGPFALAAIGFSGDTIIEVGRLLDSDVLRAAMTEHRDADVIALVADRLYTDVVGEGYPDLPADAFERQAVRVKSFRTQAWLWTG